MITLLNQIKFLSIFNLLIDYELYCFWLKPTAIKHFNLKRKPKAAAIKAELLQKAADAANHIKKHAAPTVPVRSRGMPRKMTDTSNFILVNSLLLLFLL